MPYPIKATPIPINLIVLDTFPLWLMMVLLASRRRRNPFKIVQSPQSANTAPRVHQGTQRHLKVLFITGYAENAVIGDGHLRPGMHVLTKPFAMEELGRRIKNILSTK
jgi:hypothetical protein